LYIREKKVRVGGKLYSGYYQIVEGHRDDQGRVRQRVIKYLGKFESRQQALRAAVKAGYSQALRPAERAAISDTAAEAVGIKRDPRWVAIGKEFEPKTKGRRRYLGPG